MQNEGMNKKAAYDKARHEFYRIRHLEDVERRIAKEEALSTGAYFGKSTLEVGMQLENKMFEKWKTWAQKEITLVQAARAGMTSAIPADEEDEPTSVDAEGTEAATTAGAS